MSDLSSELNLALAVDDDDTADYLVTTPGLRGSLLTLDGLFNSTTGHNHNGAHQGAGFTTLTLSQDLVVGRDAQIGRNLTVVGTSTLDGPVTVNSTLSVTGATTVNGTTNLVGATTVAGLTASGSIRADGTIQVGAGMPLQAGDLGANRGGNIGYVFFGSAGHYVGFDGTSYIMPGSVLHIASLQSDGIISGASDINASGGMTVDAANGNIGTVTNTLRFGNASGETIGSRRTGGGAFGLDFYTSSTRRGGFSQAGAFDIGGLRAVASLSGAWRVDGGSAFLSGAQGQTVQAQSFSAAFTAPPTVIVTMSNISGGRVTYHNVEVAVDGITASGFNIVFDNQSGSSQSLTINWIAFGP